MPNPRLASRYAKSLLDLAIEQNNLQDTLKDVQLLDSISRQSPEFVAMLRSPIINSDKKQQIIDAVVGGKLTVLVKAFVVLLVNKGREGNLPEIATTFIAQYKEMSNIRTVKLTTAVPMSSEATDSIRQKVAAGLPDQTIEMKVTVDPSLIGGFVLEMEDKLFDASIRKDLNDVKTQFMKNIYVSQLR